MVTCHQMAIVTFQPSQLHCLAHTLLVFPEVWIHVISVTEQIHTTVLYNGPFQVIPAYWVSECFRCEGSGKVEAWTCADLVPKSHAAEPPQDYIYLPALFIEKQFMNTFPALKPNHERRSHTVWFNSIDQLNWSKEIWMLLSWVSKDLASLVLWPAQINHS